MKGESKAQAGSYDVIQTMIHWKKCIKSAAQEFEHAQEADDSRLQIDIVQGRKR